MRMIPGIVAGLAIYPAMAFLMILVGDTDLSLISYLEIWIQSIGVAALIILAAAVLIIPLALVSRGLKWIARKASRSSLPLAQGIPSGAPNIKIKSLLSSGDPNIERMNL